ncbi:MAG: ATP-binding protein [Bacteroidales bacterium]|jgi:AAA+ superfamily predicted ATPase|nr:ATP-binding protein [Bacteroidales bacterium]
MEQLNNEPNVDVPSEDVPSENADGYCQWQKAPNGAYHPVNKITLIDELPGGKYDIQWSNDTNQYYFVKTSVVLDELLDLPNPIFKSIINDIKYFWNNKPLFDKYKYAYKRGILLFGEPGCGKTSITAQLSKIIIKMNGVVFSINNRRMLNNYADAIPKLLKRIQPDVPVLALIEDLDGLLRDSEVETLLLNILDGLYQTNNVVFMGNTNYPENLKDRILNRPSRFDKRYYIGPPNAAVRKYYFENKITADDLSKINLNELVEKSEGLTLAHLGEMIKGIFIFNKNIDVVVNELKDMKNFISSSKFDAKGSSVGFGSKSKK